MSRKLIYFFFLSLISCKACKDTSGQLQPFPLDVTININEPAYFDATAVGGWVYYNTGTAVLILYRKSTEDFMAYDNRSTYNIDAGCHVKVQTDNIIIKDDCSDSKWVITDGSITNGPASRSLLHYTTDFNSTTGSLHIYY